MPRFLEKIGSCAFEGCTSLKEVSIPDFVEKIGSCAFKGCTSLKEVRISKFTTFDHDTFPEETEIIVCKP